MTEQITRDPAADRYVATNDEGVEMGFMSYEDRGDAIAVTHTIVAPEFQGEGVAGRLVQAGLTDLRDTTDKRILPECSYVQVYVRRHPEFQDLLTR